MLMTLDVAIRLKSRCENKSRASSARTPFISNRSAPPQKAPSPVDCMMTIRACFSMRFQQSSMSLSIDGV